MPENASREPGQLDAQDGLSVADDTESGQEDTLHEAGPVIQDEELARLRSLILQREIDQLDDIVARLKDPASHARMLSRVVAEAMVLRANQDEALSRALQPVVEQGLGVFLRKRPQDVINLFFPVIGATIRRSVSESFRSMFEGFNKSLELSFSLKGLRWRMEALRSGKPFSEVVLLHTLLYRVEQVFLIHSDTGIVLSHVTNEGVEAQDADMVSGMLTAIRDFVRDCFASGQGGDLDSLRLGEFTIVIEHNPQAYLAAVVRGTPPENFHALMSVGLDLMLTECHENLVEFSGDTEPFQGLIRYMQDFLITKSADEDAPLPLWTRMLPVCLLLALVGGIGWYAFEAHERKEQAALAAVAEAQAAEARQTRLEQGAQLLNDEPGYVVYNVLHSPEGPWHLYCLADDLARPHEAVLAEAGYLPEEFTVHAAPYLSFQPELVERRLLHKLNPPESVRISLEADGLVRMEGAAPLGWILEARQTALSQPGVAAVDTTGIHDPRNEQLLDLISQVESVEVYFPLGKSVPAPAEMEKLEQAADRLIELERLAKAMGMSVSLTIYGHADAIGNDKRNYEISQERAKTLAALLYSRGSAIPIAQYGMGADHADRSKPDGDEPSRKIELRVHLNRNVDPEFVRH